jgi:hypothetical protein
MHTEYSFLFDPSLNLNTITNQDNLSNIYGRHIMVSGSTLQQGILVYKRPDVYGTANIKNYLANDVHRNDNDGDPYIQLIRYFDQTKLKSMRLRAADFAYLKDIGVYPINRLWILRRYPDNVIVPDKPTDWGENSQEPISTVIGWIKDGENESMFDLSFGENWTDQTDMIDQVMSNMLENEFGIHLKAGMAIPGWSQGILFGMLNAMGLTSDYSVENVPTGDPNVLRVAKMRDIMSQSLRSELSFKLETCYEQKYINGIDPGQAFLDVMTNLFKMGTSDQRFILNSGKLVGKFMSMLNQKNASGGQWLRLINQFVEAFSLGISNFFKEVKDLGASVNAQQEEPTTAGALRSSLTSSISDYVQGATQVLLNGTVSKYRWPLKGSIALMSGLSTTPWHLTIGNPYSPIINLANIHVKDVKIKGSSDLGFNDMPVRIEVSIDATLGRPLGKQELEKMFNNGYKRVYSKTRIDEWAAMDTRNNHTTTSGENTQDSLASRIENANTPTPQNP